jgi:hypothetical protein
VGPETTMSPCSKSTTRRLIQVPCLHRGHHAGLPPFLYPSPSIFSIFPPLFPLHSIITMPSLPLHHPSPPAAPVCLSLSFPFPFLFFFFFFFFFFSPCLPPLHLSPLPSSPIRHIPLLRFHLLSLFFLFFFFLWSQSADHSPLSVASSHSPSYPYYSRHISEMQNKGNAP